MSNSEKQQIGLILFLVYICIEASISLWRWLFWSIDSHYKFVADCIFEVLPYMILVAKTVDAVARRRANAIFWTKTTLIYLVAVSCLYLLVSNFDNLEFNLIRRLFTLCISSAWILYFRFSKQVNQIFPKEERKVSKRDKILLTLLIIPYVIGFFAGVIDGFSKARNNQEKSAVITSNEYTDGVIAFSIPEGCSCTETRKGETTTFCITKDKWMVSVSSGAISRFQEEYLNSIVEEILEETRKEQQRKGAETTTFSVFEQRGNSYIYHKKFEYTDLKEVNEVLELDAYVLFHVGTNKYAIVKESHPINSLPSGIETIVNSIRFK